MIAVELIPYPSGLSDLIPIWERLLTESPEDTVFITPEWIDLSIQHLLKEHCRPFLLLARGPSGPLAVAPLVLEETPKGKHLFLFFHDHMEHPNFILTREPEKCLEAFFDFICREIPELKQITLEDCANDSTIWSFLNSGVLDNRFSILSRPVYLSPFIPVNGSFEAYAKDRKFHKEARRFSKKSAEAGMVDFIRMNEPERAGQALEWILSIDARSWKEEAGTSIGAVKKVESFYRDLIRTAAEKGWLHLTFLTLNDQPIAYLLGFLYHNQFFSLKSSYDRLYQSLSPGINIQLQVYQEGFEQQWKKIDLLGNMDFMKGRFTDQVRPHTHFYLYPQSLFSELKKFIHTRIRPLRKKLIP